MIRGWNILNGPDHLCGPTPESSRIRRKTRTLQKPYASLANNRRNISTHAFHFRFHLTHFISMATLPEPSNGSNISPLSLSLSLSLNCLPFFFFYNRSWTKTLDFAHNHSHFSLRDSSGAAKRRNCKTRACIFSHSSPSTIKISWILSIILPWLHQSSVLRQNRIISVSFVRVEFLSFPPFSHCNLSLIS